MTEEAKRTPAGDIVDWLKGYATATAAAGMAEDAGKLLEAVEHITNLRSDSKKMHEHIEKSEAMFIHEMQVLGAEMRANWESAVFWERQATGGKV